LIALDYLRSLSLVVGAATGVFDPNDRRPIRAITSRALHIVCGSSMNAIHVRISNTIIIVVDDEGAHARAGDVATAAAGASADCDRPTAVDESAGPSLCRRLLIMRIVFVSFFNTPIVFGILRSHLSLTL
jgi:hypothetical protein